MHDCPCHSRQLRNTSLFPYKDESSVPSELVKTYNGHQAKNDIRATETRGNSGDNYIPSTNKDDEYHKQYHERRRILIVDDEPDITSSFKEALRDHGFEQVDISNDPLSALKNFKADSYDLLIIDNVMPEMEGFSLYEEVRKIDTKVNVCFITAFEINYQALRAVFPTSDDLGCFIRKPVDMDELVKRIKAEIK